MIELENGVKLGDEFMEHGRHNDPCKVTRTDAAEVFKTGSKVTEVRCHCKWGDETKDSWLVRRGDHNIDIGCCTFTPEMIAIVRKWAGVE